MMNKKIRIYQTSYQTLCLEQGPQKLCVVLRVPIFLFPSVVSNLEKLSKHLSHYQAAVVAALIQRAECCQH